MVLVNGQVTFYSQQRTFSLLCRLHARRLVHVDEMLSTLLKGAHVGMLAVRQAKGVAQPGGEGDHRAVAAAGGPHEGRRLDQGLRPAGASRECCI